MTGQFTVNSNASLGHLLDAFVKDYQAYCQQLDVFDDYWVVVPSPAVQSWLEHELTRKLGISAGLRFMRPSQALWSFQQQLDAELPDISPYDKQPMALRIFRLFGDVEKQYSGQTDVPALWQPLLRYLEKQRSNNVRMLLAERIADAFDAYLVFRPDWLDYWEGKSKLRYPSDQRLLDDHAWQASLWRLLAAEAGEAIHRADMARMLSEEAKHKDFDYFRPGRIAIFGLSTIEPLVLQQFAALSSHIDIRLYWQNPCISYWADIEAPGSKKALLDELAFDSPWLQGNALLAAWGQYARGFYAQLVESDLLDFHDNSFWEAAEPQKQTVLESIQQSIQFNENNEGSSKPDNSLVIAGHWSALREVEGLHDFLLESLQLASQLDDPLEPHEIAVMVPDIDSYAPFIEAVFDAQPYERRIPYQICGAAPTKKSIVGTAAEFLALPKGRYPISEIVDLLNLQPVREQFGLSLDDFNQLLGWISSAGIHWGLDEASWQAQQLPPHRRNTLAGGIDRMLMGLALDDDVFVLGREGEESLYYGLPGITPLKAALVGKLAAFIDELKTWRDFCEHTHQVAEWIEASVTHLNALFHVSQDELVELSGLLKSIEGLADTAAAAGMNAEQECLLDFPVFMAMLKPILDEHRHQSVFRFGKVTIGSFSATRGIPYRVTAILGANESDFPRKPEEDGIHLTEKSYRLGDRSVVAEDRFTFMQALMSTADRFYCSYVSRDIRTAEPRNPSLMIQELLDYLEKDREQQSRWIIQHPIQAFSPAYFQASRPELKTYARQWQSYQFESHADPDTNIMLEWQPGETVSIDDLLDFILSPANAFFRQQFQLVFSSPHDVLDDEETFDLDGLTKWKIKQEMIFSETGYKDCLQRWEASGYLPIGPGIEEKLDDLVQGADSIRQRLHSLLEGMHNTVLPVDLYIAPASIHVQGDIALYMGEAGRAAYIVCVSSDYKNVAPKYRLRARFYAAVLQLMLARGELAAADVYLVCEDNTYRYTALDNPEETLAAWLALYDDAMQRPVPLNAELIDKLKGSLPAGGFDDGNGNALQEQDIETCFTQIITEMNDFQVSASVLRLLHEPGVNMDFETYLDQLWVKDIAKNGNDTWQVISDE